MRRAAGHAAPGRKQHQFRALHAGNGLGIIGPSGSGKSSLARLLVGVWQPARGRICLDGATYDQWSTEALGEHIGYLPQDVELLTGTIAENIARFAPNPRSEAIIAAAKAAGVHDLIVSMPEGYGTWIGEQGASLSAGQAQRIALARALYGDPFLVVLDEPNSNLDAEGDEALTRAIVGVRARKGIVVVVAHRPSAIAGLDLILAMSQGRQIEFGPKEETLAKVLKRPRAVAAQGRSRNRECQQHEGSRTMSKARLSFSNATAGPAKFQERARFPAALHARRTTSNPARANRSGAIPSQALRSSLF